MPRTIEKTVFAFDELSDDAKEKARDWYRLDALNYDWYDFVYEDFETICKAIGVTLDRRPGRNGRGETTPGEPCIWFSGFCSQGDGACFEGSYSYKRGALKAIRAHAPGDEELAAIVRDLQDVQSKAFYQLSAKIEHSGPYYHSGRMRVGVADGRTRYGDATDAQETAITDAMRALADWLYRQLENEHDYLMSDECVDETMIANKYEFDENGEPV